MRKPPFFSVLINNYNYGRYIEKAINSVLGQTFPPEEIEIIVVDDGSTDDTVERLKKYEGRVKIILQKNGGQAAALNSGYQHARGQVIAFLDADDYWHPSKLKAIADEFRKSDAMDLVYHNLLVVQSDRVVVDRYFPPLPLPGRSRASGHEYLQRCLSGVLPWFSPTSAMAVKASCLEKIMPLPESFRLAADIYLHYVLPFYVRELSLIDKSLGYYRLHGSNLSGANMLSAEKLRREQRMLLMIMDDLGHHALAGNYDIGLLLQRMNSAIAIYDIYILGLSGHRCAAVKNAFAFNEFLQNDSISYRLSCRTAILLAVMITPKMHLRLQRIYRRLWYVFRGGRREV